MIMIHVHRINDEIHRLRIEGHAEFADKGQDIVCAAVSAITIGSVNAIEQLTGVRVHSEDDGEGKIDCHRPELDDRDQLMKLTLLFEALYLSLNTVAQEYPTYIKIIER